MNRYRSIIVTCLLLISVFLTGCATTGRGEFPNLEHPNLSESNLAILPTLGAVSGELQSSIFYHLDHDSLQKTFGSVSYVSAERAEDILGSRFSIDKLIREKPTSVEQLTDADLFLALQVNEFAVKEFTTTETRTLYRTNTSYSNTTVFSTETESGNGKNGRKNGPENGPGRRVGPDESNGDGDKETKDTLITTTESQTSSQEIPVTRGNIRVVLSMSAVLYDVNENRVIWKGRRIERAQDELDDLSSIELKDIVVERIMYRLNNRLTAGH